jgi:hypothetical protein
MKGPWKLDPAGADGSGLATGAAVGETTISGTGPVDPTDWPEETGAAGVCEGRTMGAAELPVGPTIPPSSDESSPPAGALAEGVGCTETTGTTLEGAELGMGVADDAGTMMPGRRPVDPITGARGLGAALDDSTGAGSGIGFGEGSGEGVGCRTTGGTSDDEGPRAGLEETTSGEGVGCRTTGGTSADEGPRAGLEGTTSGVSLFGC